LGTTPDYQTIKHLSVRRPLPDGHRRGHDGNVAVLPGAAERLFSYEDPLASRCC
jgi:hypothetical protein